MNPNFVGLNLLVVRFCKQTYSTLILSYVESFALLEKNAKDRERTSPLYLSRLLYSGQMSWLVFNLTVSSFELSTRLLMGAVSYQAAGYHGSKVLASRS